jgi:hypothetical protein
LIIQSEDEEGTLGLQQSARLQRQKEVKLSQISLLIVVGKEIILQCCC